ncbi:protein-L-isoaspartate O-methyltransferase [Hyphomicrobium sp. D-2]|uniref:protein-L-isoaspartate O-methyltransferase family protein n=1 Tax=Hyphomicrobium sp. D-2 TaxID=3041621 RepID=UPI0024576347|nr:protein-L-isoaspartate O-methyltransferase [Hyphomicrobium sp. D-2]MDH4982253.1 protein-L-isoaspartate O-methyltransferase [Hyphomicrobium sp. D-2]
MRYRAPQYETDVPETTMVDAATQRLNMVEGQVLPSDVTDRRILDAMRRLPRERFVPEALTDIAYTDEALPLTGDGAGRRRLLAPRTQAKLLQLADVNAGDRVLVVGCATGYGAAILSGMGGTIIALECDENLAEAARANLEALDIQNVQVNLAPLAAGSVDNAPFDAIVIEGAIEVVPDDLLDQLKDGGRLVAILVEDGVGTATLWKRLGRSADPWGAFDVAAPVLPGFARKAAFAL